LRAAAGLTGNVTGPKPSTSRLRSSVLAVSSTPNAVFASPCNVLASRSRAAVAMVCALPYPSLETQSSNRDSMGLPARDGIVYPAVHVGRFGV
jgi:hypothetical protein